MGYVVWSVGDDERRMGGDGKKKMSVERV